VTPDTSTPAGYAVRSALLDIISIYEINRKECARLLLEYPKWAPVGTFKPKSGASSEAPPEGKNWQLENTIVEVITHFCYLLSQLTFE
jgi:nuclear cap-binding protein subunit 1